MRPNLTLFRLLNPQAGTQRAATGSTRIILSLNLEKRVPCREAWIIRSDFLQNIFSPSELNPAPMQDTSNPEF